MKQLKTAATVAPRSREKSKHGEDAEPDSASSAVHKNWRDDAPSGASTVTTHKIRYQM